MDWHHMWAFDLLNGLGSFLQHLFSGLAAFLMSIFV